MFYHLYDTINWTKYSPALSSLNIQNGRISKSSRAFLLVCSSTDRTAGFKRGIVRALAGVLRKTIKPELFLGFGLRFGPYGQGLNPFRKSGLTLGRLKKNPHGMFLSDLYYTLPEGLRTPDKKIQLTPAAFVNDLPRLRAWFFEGQKEQSEATR